MDICNKVQSAIPPSKTGKKVHITSDGPLKAKANSAITCGEGGITKGPDKPFDSMNNIVANLILNMTSSARFEGSLNVDLNEITMNLVPFPKLHYLVSSQTPLYALTDVKLPPRRLNQMFTDGFSKDHQLIKADPKHNLYLACALIVRGNVEVSDIRRNIERLKPSLKFIYWNQEGWKTGLCSVPPVGHPYSLLTLANNSCIKDTFQDLKDRFMRLYKRKAHVHHYTNIGGLDIGQFDTSIESLTSLMDEYTALESSAGNIVQYVERLQIA